MRILLGCETSGVGRQAFAALGHEVWSVDLEPSEDDSPFHIIDDVRKHLNGYFDMAILHPPCTRLTNAGVRWMTKPPVARTLESMWQELEEGVRLFQACLDAPIPRVCVENPVMNPYARSRLVGLRKPQIVQPWWFGEKAFKATGLYLRGLPPLTATNKLVPPKPGTQEHKEWSFIHRMPPGPDRARLRSRSFAGIMNAMASQWAQ